MICQEETEQARRAKAPKPAEAVADANPDRVPGEPNRGVVAAADKARARDKARAVETENK